jgi:hypothetical protein
MRRCSRRRRGRRLGCVSLALEQVGGDEQVSQPPREMADIWRPLLPTKRYSISGRSLGTSADILKAVEVVGDVRNLRFVVSLSLTTMSLLLL